MTIDWSPKPIPTESAPAINVRLLTSRPSEANAASTAIVISNEQEYDDILALSDSYSWPVADNWRLGVGGFYVSDMIDDENRTMAPRLDSMWSLGVGFQWQWKDNRNVTASLNYLETGDAPVSTPEIPGIGSVAGAFTNRQTIYFRIAISFGPVRS